MIERRTVLAAVFGVLALTATIHADMMSPSSLRAGYGQSPCIATDHQHTNLCSSFSWPGITLPDLLPVTSLTGSKDAAEQVLQTQPAYILSDGQTSFSLCLYALVGLGLCKSAPFVKKLSFGCIPEWYHNGGPFQIGHSHAVPANNLSITPVCCFIQPDYAAEGLSPQYYTGTVVSLWRKSQFTSTVLAPRGPPNMS